MAALLEQERVLAERLAAARAEAARIVAAAREDAEHRDAGLEGELAAARRDLDVRMAQERERRLAAVGEDARHRVEAWTQVSAARVTRAAEAVLAALIAGPGRERP